MISIYNRSLYSFGPLFATFEALPYLKQQQESHIVNITSLGGRIHLTAYCSAKFAEAGFSDATRSELAKENVHVMTVCPDLMRTGSPVNAIYKGSPDKEFRWFSSMATSPLFAINAKRAAQQIIYAIQKRRPELTISIQARVVILAQALFPSLIGKLMVLLNKLLPKFSYDKPSSSCSGREIEARGEHPSIVMSLRRIANKFNQPQP